MPLSDYFPIGTYPSPESGKPARGEWNENQRPILAIKRVTMLSDRFNCSLVARAVRRAVLSAVSINLIVARISAAEHAFPALILAAHFMASAIVVTLTKSITSSTVQFRSHKGAVD